MLLPAHFFLDFSIILYIVLSPTNKIPNSGLAELFQIKIVYLYLQELGMNDIVRQTNKTFIPILHHDEQYSHL